MARVSADRFETSGTLSGYEGTRPTGQASTPAAPATGTTQQQGTGLGGLLGALGQLGQQVVQGVQQTLSGAKPPAATTQQTTRPPTTTTTYYPQTQGTGKIPGAQLVSTQQQKDPYVEAAEAALAQHDAMTAPEYQNQYADKINSLMQELSGRKFQYNFSDDPLYRQYAARYAQQANQAMRDTLGQAQAMGGGYGNSYAAAAGNQAYQNAIAGMNDKALDLRNTAYSQWADEGTAMQNRLNAYNTLEQNDYNKYKQRLSQYNTDRDAAWERYKYWIDRYETNRWNQAQLAAKTK